MTWDAEMGPAEFASSEEGTSPPTSRAHWTTTTSIVKEALCMDLTMTICRLSEPPTTGKHRNHSLRTLLDECDDTGGTDRMLVDFLAACEPVRQLGHQQMRTNDLSTTLEPGENPLPGIGKGQVDEILGLADRILNVISQEYANTVLIFQPVLAGGADALLDWLRLAKQAEEERTGKRQG